jgi:hypothetical protein
MHIIILQKPKKKKKKINTIIPIIPHASLLIRRHCNQVIENQRALGIGAMFKILN